MKVVKKILKWVGIVIIVLILSFLLLKFYGDRTYFSNYDSHLPLNPQVEEVKEFNDVVNAFNVERPRRFQSIKFSYESRTGERVPALLLLPMELKGKVPCIVFLHGIGQSKGFIHDIGGNFIEKGFAIASFDQIMQGERKIKGGWLKQGFAFYRRPSETINDARRLIDYLETHPDIDSNRIYLVGASYGSITGCTLTAFEKRIKASVLVVGGGDISLMLDAPAIKNNSPRWLHIIGKPIVVFIMNIADPIHYAKNTSPTPVLFLNGDQDTLVTPESGKALFEAAGEPKEMRWYPIDHPGIRDKDGPEVIRLLDDGLAWLIEQDNKIKQNEANVAEN
ncbi:MAG TPA: alpha/beta hydrolase [Candidatus Hydrogenedens sp.]|nr:alpha/beta hydrolase [Candidatus Hydrogenedens sp.]